MGSRGKKRRRANGELAVSRRGNQSFTAPLMVNWSDEPMDPVPADLLAQALTISNRHVPISPNPTLDGGGYEDEEAFQSAFAEMKSAFGEVLARKIDARLYNFRKFLSNEGAAYYSVGDDGAVTVNGDLLEFAATSSLSEHPDDRLRWSPHQAKRP